MATTITPVENSDTPFSKMFVLVGDGAAGLFSINDFAAALHLGPLRDTLLNAPPLTVDDFNINDVRGDEIRIYVVPLSPTDADTNLATPRTIRWVAGATQDLAGLSCTLPAQGELGNQLTIEIRLNHSTQG